MKIQKRGVRRGKLKLFCASCSKWFQLNRGEKKIDVKSLTLLHLNGVSFRSIAEDQGLSVGNVYQKIEAYLSSLPHCADVTRKYCNAYSGILLVDGKYVAVKGQERKIPVLYGVDYTTHDIPHYLLSLAENYQTCLTFFRSLKLLNYPLQALVCDENTNIYEACQFIYPKASVQICQNHYKENIRRGLDLTNNPDHVPFMKEIEDLFSFKRSKEDFDLKAKAIFDYYNSNQIYLETLVQIQKDLTLLTGWRALKGVPTTTNLIECFNSHLQGRLKTIKGFETFKHADIWLNGYFLRRRTKKFTDCTGKFKILNGKTSLDRAKIQNIVLPTYFT